MDNLHQEFLKRAKEIIDLNVLLPYVEAVLDLWINTESPSLGHGFGHVLNVAVECYELAILNKYEQPKELFIAGLLHDVYRPAEGKDGQEDHHQKSYEMSLKILKDIDADPQFIKKFKYALSDGWKTSERLDDFSSLLFLGDKICLDRHMADAYAWASNSYCKNMGKELVYKTALHTMNGFVKYFSKILPVLILIELKGKDRIVNNFVDIVISLKEQHIQDPQGIKFQEYLAKEALSFSKKEYCYLNYFISDENRIRKLIHETDVL